MNFRNGVGKVKIVRCTPIATAGEPLAESLFGGFPALLNRGCSGLASLSLGIISQVYWCPESLAKYLSRLVACRGPFLLGGGGGVQEKSQRKFVAMQSWTI